MIRAAALALPLLLASSALAGTVSHSADLLLFVGRSQNNQVTITEFGRDGFVVIDRAGRLRAGGDCFRDTGRRVQCPAGDREHDVVARLGRGVDTLAARLDPGNFRDRANGIDARGGPGNDRLVARGRTVATFYGEEDNDVLTAAPKLDPRHLTILSGGPGRDRLNGTGTGVVLNGGTGDDKLFALDGDDNDLSGGDGDDLLSLGDGGGLAFAGPGADEVRAGDDPTRINAGAGDDLIDATGTGRDLIECGAGVDTVRLGPGDRFGRVGGGDEPDDPAAWGCENVTPVA